MAITEFPKAELTDLPEAEVVEISFDATGKFLVNVNGKCLLRVGHVDLIMLDSFGFKFNRSFPGGIETSGEPG